MAVNKHIQALAAELDLGEYDQDRLQCLWDNRNKMNFIILSVAHVSGSGMSRDFKAGFIYRGEFVRLTHLIAEVTDSKVSQKTNGVSIGGCGMDMGFALLDRFYSRLIPSNSKVRAHELLAVQYYINL